MENNFDKFIRERMERMEVPKDGAQWGKMEQLLDQQAGGGTPDIEDVYLDGMVYDNLNTFEVPYEEGHWDAMRARLDDPYAIRRRVMKYKVIEVALLLLFVFTFWQYLPNSTAKMDRTPRPIADLSSPATTPNDQQQTAGELSSDQLTTSATLERATLAESASAGALAGLQQASATTLAAAGTYNRTASTTSEANASNLLATQTTRSTYSALRGGDAMVTPLSNLQLLSANLVPNEPGLNLLPTLAPGQLLMNPSEMMRIQPKLVDPQPDHLAAERLLVKSPAEGRRLRVGMVFGPDVNYVMTPYDDKFRQDPFNQYALGYSGGLTLSFQYNRWEVETGAIYSAKSYGARNTYEIQGSFFQGGYVRKGLAGSELDILRIPLNVRYNMVVKRKWNFYMLTGASVNMALERLHQFTNQTVGNSEIMASPVPGGALNLVTDLHRDPGTYDGLFEGGSIFENTYLSANLGVGVERFFGGRMSIFFEPVYQQQFTRGMGPQKDQINTMSLQTGVRVNLGAKR